MCVQIVYRLCVIQLVPKQEMLILIFPNFINSIFKRICNYLPKIPNQYAYHDDGGILPNNLKRINFLWHLSHDPSLCKYIIVRIQLVANQAGNCLAFVSVGQTILPFNRALCRANETRDQYITRVEFLYKENLGKVYFTIQGPSREPIWNRVQPISGGRLRDKILKNAWKTDMLYFILLCLKIFKHVAFFFNLIDGSKN